MLVLVILLVSIGSNSSAQDMKSVVHDFKIQPETLDALYCPFCQLPLKRVKILDVFMQGLMCGQGHRFYVPLRTPLELGTERVASAVGSRKSDNLSVIRDWLTKIELRSLLNNQLATMLRRIYEISTDNIHVTYAPSAAHEYAIFKYCPLCTTPLKPYDQEDVWVQGLRCSNHHEFKMRNGISFLMGEKTGVQLQEEMADETLNWLTDRWLRDNPALKDQLHPQITTILKQFREFRGH